jgi:ABC-type Fe3+ transport system substrate-binding protein
MTRGSRLAAAGLALLMGLPPVLSPGAAIAAEDIFNYSGPDRASKLLEGAKKEGQVMFYSGMIVDQMLRPMADSFGKKYPGIKMGYWRGDSREIVQKVVAEARGRSRVADVYESSGIAGPTIKAGIAQPYTSPSAAKYAPQHVSKDRFYVASRLSYFGMAFNTRQFAEKDVPKTYDDLLEPKWKDKLSWRAQSETGQELFMANILKIKGDKEGEAYLKKLSAQNVVNYSGSARALVDRVGEGEFPLALNIFAHHPLISKAKGAPLDVQMIEPIPSVYSTAMIVKNAPHPHAAMLFVDYLLDTEAQKVISEADYFPPHPDVKPTENLAKILPRNNGMKENAFSSEEIFDFHDRVMEIYDRDFK